MKIVNIKKINEVLIQKRKVIILNILEIIKEDISKIKIEEEKINKILHEMGEFIQKSIRLDDFFNKMINSKKENLGKKKIYSKKKHYIKNYPII